MPPFFDDDQIHDALRIDALPALGRFAVNPNLRDRTLNRFDRDEPPPYTSSTESDEEEAAFHPSLGLGSGSVLQEFETLMDALLTTTNITPSRMAYKITGLLNRFYFSQHSNLDAKEFLQGRAGEQRQNVIIRRNIRRRWQKLGIWNPRWGIPGRVNEQPSDDILKWKWRWQHGSSAAKWHIGAGSTALNSQHPITRAVRLRQGLHRGEHSPVPPRSRLEEDTSAAQAESFIISRPWFTYFVEVGEEGERFDRIPSEKQRFYTDPVTNPVIEWWKQRGNWREDWEVPGGEEPVPGWKCYGMRARHRSLRT